MFQQGIPTPHSAPLKRALFVRLQASLGSVVKISAARDTWVGGGGSVAFIRRWDGRAQADPRQAMGAFMSCPQRQSTRSLDAFHASLQTSESRSYRRHSRPTDETRSEPAWCSTCVPAMHPALGSEDGIAVRQDCNECNVPLGVVSEPCMAGEARPRTALVLRGAGCTVPHFLVFEHGRAHFWASSGTPHGFFDD